MDLIACVVFIILLGTCSLTRDFCVYTRAVLNAIKYLDKFGYTEAQVYICCPASSVKVALVALWMSPTRLPRSPFLSLYLITMFALPRPWTRWKYWRKEFEFSTRVSACQLKVGPYHLMLDCQRRNGFLLVVRAECTDSRWMPC